MKLNVKVMFLGQELSSSAVEGIEVSNYNELSSLTMDSESIQLIHNKIVPNIIGVNSENNDPYKINIQTLEYSSTSFKVEDNSVVPTVYMNVIHFTYADLDFFDDGDWGIYPIDDAEDDDYNNEAKYDDFYDELVGISCNEVLRELKSLKNNHKLTVEPMEVY